MASLNSSLPLLITVAISLLSLHAVECVELDVGGDNGWATPSSRNQLFYNDWASKNRFKVNDTLSKHVYSYCISYFTTTTIWCRFIHVARLAGFAYKKDSVMVVTEEEYEKCRSSHPMFFANNGDTVFSLDRPGLFYFISGVAAHCQRGLKMIVKVLEPEAPPQAAAATSSSSAAFAAQHFIPLAAASLVGGIFMWFFCCIIFLCFLPSNIIRVVFSFIWLISDRFWIISGTVRI